MLKCTTHVHAQVLQQTDTILFQRKSDLLRMGNRVVVKERNVYPIPNKLMENFVKEIRPIASNFGWQEASQI